MQLYEKILTIYPELTISEFLPSTGTIILQDDGAGEYIKSWINELPRPTDEQLASIN